MSTPDTPPKKRKNGGGPQPGAGNKPGVSQVRNEAVVRIQAGAFLREAAINGGDVRAIAAKFNTSPAIVKSRLSYAQRALMFTQHEDMLLAGIVPQAERIILGFLQPEFLPDANGELVELRPTKDQADLAAKVFSGTGLFRKPGTTAPAAANMGGKAGESLEDYIAKLRVQGAELSAQIAEEATDVEFSVLGQPESTPVEGLRSGDQPAAGEARAAEGDADADGRTAEGTGPAAGDVDTAAGARLGGGVAEVSGEAEPRAGEAGERHHRVTEFSPPLPFDLPGDA